MAAEAPRPAHCNSVSQNEEIRRRTIFVRNLPFDTRGDQLEKIFAEVGPIKRAFVVKDPDKRNANRGFGYVQFVLQEDADKAVKSIQSYGNRALRLSFAAKKPKHKNREKNVIIGEVDEEENEAASERKANEEVGLLDNKKRNDKQHNKASEKEGSKNEIDRAEELKKTIVITGLKEKVRRKAIRILCENFGEVDNIVYPVSERSEVTAFVRFREHVGAIRAVQIIPGLKVNQSDILSAVLLTKENKFPSKKVMNRSRLIIRNLSFKCEKEHLHEVFSKFGKILDVNIPTKVVNDKAVKIGFAFVQFMSPQNAKAAVEEMNLKEIKGRPIVVDWAVSKDVYASKQSKDGVEESAEGNKKKDDKKKLNENKGEKVTNVKELEETSDVESDENDEMLLDSDDPDIPDGNTVSESEDEDSQESDAPIESDIGNDDDDDVIEKKPKRQMKDAKEGKTIFVRNLSYNVEEEELQEEFEKYGDVEYVKIVYDEQSGHSKGSAFIKFEEKQSADDFMDDFKKKEAQGVNIVIDGRPISASLAVTKGKLSQIQREKSEGKKERDKRNLYLAYEGLIARNSPAAQGLSDADLKKREKALAQKKAKLKDPNYSISRTRLCVQNLPLTVDADNLRIALMQHVSNEMKVKEIKISRNKERRDISGKPRSLGFGFIELESHEDALSLLRATNNNPNVFTENRRPIVEFAVENGQALKILELKKQRLENKNTAFAENEGAGGKECENGGAGGKEEQKGIKQRMREKHLKRIARYRKKREQKKLMKNDEEIEGITAVESKLKDSYKVKKSTVAEEGNEMKTNKPGIKRRLPNAVKPDGECRRKTKKKDEKEEERFNSMVKQYKQRLFGNSEQNISKKKSDSRWFE